MRNVVIILGGVVTGAILFNQFALKRRREGEDLNRRKNDYRDSEVAAQLLCTGEFTEIRLPQGNQLSVVNSCQKSFLDSLI